MASYVVAAALFMIGSSYLLHFVIEPPGSNTAALDHQVLRINAQTALDVLLGTPGYPAAWEENVVGITRLGLIEKGTSIRIDADKFDALARGRLATSTADDYVDYAEAKVALGIEDYEFHLRAYPVTDPADTTLYGLEDMDSFRVAYVGHWDGEVENASSKSERFALESLELGFSNTTRALSITGDVYQDKTADFRANLLPVIGPTIQETVISAGSGTKYDFYRVNATSYDPLADPEVVLPAPTLTTAMALSSDGATLGYSKGREVRAVLGEFDVTGNAGTIEWREWVDTDRGNGTYDCGDFGFVEVSFNDGATWTRLTDTDALRSQDCNVGLGNTHGSLFSAEEVVFTCAPACTQGLLAFHWVGDNDNNIGYGWVVDDVVVTSGGGVVLSETFTTPEYDMLILGSNADHDAFVADDIKDGIRDYVNLYGGRLMVLGGENNVNWLDRLLDAGNGGGSGGVANPDTTHPLLTLPNQLSFTGYSAADDWDFETDQAPLFSMVMGNSATSQYLSVSRQGAWGSGTTNEGAVILTSYKPFEWTQEETRKFFANAAIYGKYHYLFLEVGPEIPSGEAVASVARSATMNKYRTGEANYTEMAFVMYLWPGASSASTLAAAALTPTGPRGVSVESTDGHAWVNWSRPLSNGTSTVTAYEVWRGFGPTTIGGEPVATVSNATFSYHDTSVVNGLTYYYNVTAVSSVGRGTPSSVNSTTPLTLPAAPGSFVADPDPGLVTLSWANPGTNYTGTVLGYRIQASSALAGTYSTIAEVGNVTSYAYAPGDNEDRYFKIEAMNARGYGTQSAAVGPAAAEAATPISGPTLVVTSSFNASNLSLSWVAPDLLGQTLESWLIWRSSTSDTEGFALVTNLTNPGARAYEDSGLDAGTTYWYKVQGVTNVGMGANSTAESAVPIGLAGAPTAFTVSNSTAGTLSLSWVAPVDLNGGVLSGYRIWRSADGSEWSLLASPGALNTSFADAGLSNNATWSYRIQGVTEVGGGTNTTSVQKTTAGVPYPPHSVSASSTLITTTVGWTNGYSAATITSYEIHRADSQNGEYTLYQTSLVNPLIHAEGNVGKWFKVRAYSAAGWSAFSAPDQA